MSLKIGVSTDASGWPLFRVRDMQDPRPSSPESQGLADLFEAAPDLLEACKAMYAALHLEYGHGVDNGYWPEMKPVLKQGREAITKAEAVAKENG